MLYSSFDLFTKARAGHYAIGAFNTSNVDVMKAIVSAAQKMKSPVIVETSTGERDFAGADVLVGALQEMSEQVDIPIVLHMDHGKSLESIQQVINAGYTSVHFDGSSLPYEENVAMTAQAVELTKGRDISVEGEIERIKGGSYYHQEGEEQQEDLTPEYTDPQRAQDFVSRTGIDCLAVSIGNIHGVYPTPPTLNLQLLAELNSTVDCFMSLHGGSGITEQDIRGAVQNGIVKVNVNTELRQAYIGGLREELAENPQEVVPYKILPEVMERVEQVVMEKIRLFGSENKA